MKRILTFALLLLSALPSFAAPMKARVIQPEFGMDRQALRDRLLGVLPAINAELPKYAQVRKVEFMPEDFERTPKRSIKRYLYQRQA